MPLIAKQILFFTSLFLITAILFAASGLPAMYIILCITVFAVLAEGSYYISQKHYSKIFDKLTNIKISLKSFENKENNFDNKISELQQILQGVQEDMESSKEKFSREIFSNIKKILEEFINQLEETKKYKVNRSEFLGNVAHELNTPIFTVQLSLETLIDGAVNDKNVNIDFLKKALKSTKRLAELTKDLIEISKLETGKRISKRYHQVNELIRESAETVVMIAQNKNIALKYDFRERDNVKCLCDAEMIKQVMVNLLENAVKYTNEGGEIVISTEPAERGVKVSVSDNGIGISEKDLPRIFERFYRVDKDRSRDMGGSGLGLAIVKHALDLHGSRIFVTSRENQGTKFEFVLPK